MLTNQRVLTAIVVSTVIIDVAVRYDDEEIPYDFPLRVGDRWKARVDIDTGVISGWPEGQSGRLNMKVCDQGVYTLLSPTDTEIAKIDGYVPHGLVPGEYGDYIDLVIDATGTIINWPNLPNVDDFLDD